MARARIAIDFPDQAAALAYFHDLKADGYLPDNAQLVQMDGLDQNAQSGGVTTGNTLLVRYGRTHGVVAS